MLIKTLPACFYLLTDEDKSPSPPGPSQLNRFSTNRTRKLSSLLQMTNGWEFYQLTVSKIVVEKKTRSLVEFRQLNEMLHLSANLSYKFLEKE